MTSYSISVLELLYKKADKSKEGILNESEFAKLLQFLSYYINLQSTLLEQGELNDNKVINSTEFERLCKIQVPGFEYKSTADPVAEFAQIDSDNSGSISLLTFCMYKSFAYADSKKSLYQAFKDGFSKKKADIVLTENAIAETKSKEPLDLLSNPQQPSSLSPSKHYDAPKLTTKLSDKDIHDLFVQFDITNRNGM
jgi:hypothetical protein